MFNAKRSKYPDARAWNGRAPFLRDRAFLDECSEFITESGCQIWMKSVDGQGYGSIRLNGRETGAHRVSWLLENGPIPKGMWVLHRCDVRPCINPDHLFLGTHADNMADMRAKGRANVFGRKQRRAA